MKRKNNDMARRVSVRPLVAYPAVSIALVVSAALAWTPLAASTATALDTSPTPAATATATAAPSPTSSAPSSATVSPGPSPTSSAPSSPTAPLTPSPSPGPSPTGVASPAGVPVDRHVLAWIDGSSFRAHYFPVNAAVLNASQFQTIRVRFSIHNAGTTPITAAPQLEYRAAGARGYVVVPEKPLKGIPFQVVREWVPSAGRAGGTVQGPLGESIPVATFRTGRNAGGLAMIGHHSMGANPDRPITLPSDSFTEQEFTIALTIDAKYLTGYDFRITDGHSLLAGTQVAQIQLGLPPEVRLSANQKQGLAVGGPRPASTRGVVK